MAELTDEQIHKMAKARVGFKAHLIVYVCVNLFFSGVWLVTAGMDGIDIDAGPGSGGDDYYWPIWTHMGWGLGLAIHGFMTYGPGNNMLAREEERLRREMGKT